MTSVKSLGQSPLVELPWTSTSRYIVHGRRLPRDDEACIKHHEARLQEDGKPELAYQVRIYGWETARFNSIHRRRLAKLKKDKRCTASIDPGVAVSNERRVPESTCTDADVHMPDVTEVHSDVGSGDHEEDEADEDEEDEEGEELEDVDGEGIADCIEGIWRITFDDADSGTNKS